MTVANTTRSVDYPGDDVQVTFSYPFRIFESSHLVVKSVNDATGVETVKTNVTHYTVTGVGVPSGGTVTMLTAPATGETLYLERVVPLTQIHNLRNQGTFTPQSTEDALDRIVMMIQSMSDSLTITLNDIIESGGIPSFTRTTRPNVSGDAAVGAFWSDKLIILIEDDGQKKLQRCMERVTDDTYDWQTENTGGIL